MASKFTQALVDLVRLDDVENELQDMYDRVAKNSGLLDPGQTPLGEFGLDVRDELYRILGKATYRDFLAGDGQVQALRGE